MRWITNRCSAPHAAAATAISPAPTTSGWPTSIAAFRDPAIDAVWCIRGGYGVDPDPRRRRFRAAGAPPTTVIGFSDITALLAGGHPIAGVVAFHGPVARASHAAVQPTALRAGADAGRGRREVRPLPEPRRRARAHGRTGSSRSGGHRRGQARGRQPHPAAVPHRNPYGFPTSTGRILVLEDVNEDLYRVDRMLAHLRAVGRARPAGRRAVGRFGELQRHTRDGAFGFDELLASTSAALRPRRARPPLRAHRRAVDPAARCPGPARRGIARPRASLEPAVT